MKKAFYTMAMLLTVFSSQLALCQDKITEIVLASEEWPNATKADGTGLYWEIFKAVYEPVGIQVKHRISSYAGSEELIKRQSVDAMVGAYKDEVEKAVFPENHFAADTVQVLFKKGKLAEWKGQESISGKKVGWIKGYDFDQYLDVPMEKAEFDERKDALRVLDKDRIDFFMDAQPDLIDALESGVIDKSAYQRETVKQINLYVAFSDNEKGKKLQQIFDERFPQLVRSGEIKKLYDKWQIGNFTYPF
jgi:polar amino acid transport system substrate-binding protein